MDDKLECWERDERCGDCPVDHPENKRSEYKKEVCDVLDKTEG